MRCRLRFLVEMDGFPYGTLPVLCQKCCKGLRPRTVLSVVWRGIRTMQLAGEEATLQ